MPGQRVKGEASPAFRGPWPTGPERRPARRC